MKERWFFPGAGNGAETLSVKPCQKVEMDGIQGIEARFQQFQKGSKRVRKTLKSSSNSGFTVWTALTKSL